MRSRRRVAAPVRSPLDGARPAGQPTSLTLVVAPSLTQRISSIDWVGPRVMLRLHRAGFGFATVTWSEFADRVEQGRPDAVTIDVFETCVVRDLAGDRAIEEVASRWATGGAGDRPVPVLDRADAIARLELDLCRPVPGAAEGLDRVRAAIGPIVFVSDTDRSSSLLVEMLEGHGLFRAGDRLVASGETTETKSGGGLYDLIWTTRPETVWHLGNHNWSDGVMAAAHGYEPFDAPAGNLSRYEAALCRSSDGMGPVLAGAARSIRLELERQLEQGELDERTFHLRRLGAQVAGPVMTAFALWIADQVGEHDIDHLGFLARDGELPQLIAGRVPDPALERVDRSYVHLNRLAVTLAMAPAIGIDAWVKEGVQHRDDFLLARMPSISFAGLLQRIGFEPGDVASVLGPRSVLSALDPQAPLPESHLDDWLELLAGQSTQELILDRATERRTLIVDYLDQLGVLSSTRPAFVDVGWRGRIARLIDTALLEFFSNEPIHLHFGGDQVPPEVDELVRIHRFAFPGTSKIAPFDDPPSPVETITASGNPRVVHYRRTPAGTVEPIFQPEAIDVGRADRSELWTGAMAMADRLPTSDRIAAWQPHRRPLDEEAREVLRLWWYEPDRAEASALRGFAFEGDEAGAQVCPVVAPYVLTDVIGRNRGRRQWRQGSGIISSPPSRIGLAVAMSGRRLLRMLRRPAGAR